MILSKQILDVIHDIIAGCEIIGREKVDFEGFIVVLRHNVFIIPGAGIE